MREKKSSWTFSEFSYLSKESHCRRGRVPSCSRVRLDVTLRKVFRTSSDIFGYYDIGPQQKNPGTLWIKTTRL